MKKMLYIKTKNWSGCMNLQELQQYNNNELPKVGDILFAEVQSKKQFGFFMIIARLEHNYRCTLNGLLHQSNLLKGSKWSIGNTNIPYSDYDLNKRNILVEIINISDKGYSLKEVDYIKNITIDNIYNDEKLKKIVVSQTNIQEKEYYNAYSDTHYYIKIVKKSEFLIYSPKYDAFIFEDQIYIYMYFANVQHYFTKDLSKSISFIDRENIKFCFHEDYQERELDISTYLIWESNASIAKHNEETEKNYKIFNDSVDYANKVERLHKQLESSKPDYTIKMYKGFHFFMHTAMKISNDRSGQKRFIDNDKIVYVNIHTLENNKYIGIENKFYPLDEKRILLNNECLLCIGSQVGNLSVYFKYGISSDVIIAKYQNYFKHSEFKDLYQGEEKDNSFFLTL